MRPQRIVVALASLAAIVLSWGCQTKSADQQGAPAATSAVAMNKAACQRFFDQALAAGDTAAVDTLVAPGLVEHQSPPPGYPSNPTAALKQFIRDWHVAFPDMRVTIDRMVGEGDVVAIYSTMSGTNNGPFMGMKPTHKPMEVEGFDLVRFENGKMAEHWGVLDMYGMMAQLGVVKPPGAK